MQDELLLKILKVDLGIMHNKHDDFLLQLLSTARQNIISEGITLDDTDASMSLIRMYAAWQYRQRANPENRMPKMIRSNLNNRLFAQKAKVETDV